MERKGFEFSFAWLFALIVGGVIIFIAIFMVTRIITTGNIEYTTRLGGELATILSPVETNLESGKTYFITFPQETRLFNRCDINGVFGTQEISVAVRSSPKQPWKEEGFPTTFHNKYLFSSALVEGKNFYLFVKPYRMPYKVADLIIAYTKDYCFVNAPEEVKADVESLDLEKVALVTSKTECSTESITVCFQSDSCDIVVDTNRKVVLRDRKTLYYYDSLLYGAIFADESIYECQAQRLLHRASQLAELYTSKSEFSAAAACSGTLGQEVKLYGERLRTGVVSSLPELGSFSESIKNKNERITCPLF